jgi:hypothetical protein
MPLGRVQKTVLGARPSKPRSKPSLYCRETAFRRQRQVGAKPPTGSANRSRRPTAFAQSRHVAVIHGQFGKSPFDRESVVGLRGLKLRAKLQLIKRVFCVAKKGLLRRQLLIARNGRHLHPEDRQLDPHFRLDFLVKKSVHAVQTQPLRSPCPSLQARPRPGLQVVGAPA